MIDPNPHIVAAVVISCASFGLSLAAIALAVVVTIGR